MSDYDELLRLREENARLRNDLFKRISESQRIIALEERLRNREEQIMAMQGKAQALRRAKQQREEVDTRQLVQQKRISRRRIR